MNENALASYAPAATLGPLVASEPSVAPARSAYQDSASPDSRDFGRSSSWLPVIHKDQIDGQVIFIDSYRNAITNIPKTEFARIGTNRTFEITIKSNRYKIYGISNTYLESDPGELLAIFNTAGLLEIAIVQGNAAELLGLEPGTPIKIRFDESTEIKRIIICITVPLSF